MIPQMNQWDCRHRSKVSLVPSEGPKDDKETGASDIQGEAERAGVVMPGKEKVLGWEWICQRV